MSVRMQREGIESDLSHLMEALRLLRRLRPSTAVPLANRNLFLCIAPVHGRRVRNKQLNEGKCSRGAAKRSIHRQLFSFFAAVSETFIWRASNTDHPRKLRRRKRESGREKGRQGGEGLLDPAAFYEKDTTRNARNRDNGRASCVLQSSESSPR